MQGNLYNPKAYIYFTIVVFPLAAIIALFLDQLFSSIGLSQSAKIIIGTPTGIGVLFSIFNFFDRKAWRWDIFRRMSVIAVPYLGGRWNGTVKSSHNGDTTVDAVLEISQTFSRICVSLYTKTSESHSIIAGFLRSGGGIVTLNYLYQNKPHAMTTMLNSQQGSAILKVLKGGKMLDGFYYNNGRERTTFGQTEFVWSQKELLNSFS